MARDLSYQEWNRYCFDRETSGPQWYWQPGSDGEGDWYQPTPSILAGHLRRLFTDSRDLLATYSEPQIAQSLYFICSSGSSYFQVARDPSVSATEQADWVAAISSLYSDFFATQCSHFYGHLDSGPEPARPLNALCYMFWDLDCIEDAAMFPGEEHLIEPIFATLTSAFGRSNPACMESALHGLGHLQAAHPERVERIIADFLASIDAVVTTALRTNAKHAADGCIQ